MNIFDHESKQLIKVQKCVATNTIHFLQYIVPGMLSSLLPRDAVFF